MYVNVSLTHFSLYLAVNESAEAVIRHNIYTHKNIARVTEDGIVELVVEDGTVNQEQDQLMTSAAQEMMVCLYRNQLLNVFVRVAMITIPINSCVRDTLPIGKQLLDFSLPVFKRKILLLVIYLAVETVVCSTQYLMVYV